LDSRYLKFRDGDGRVTMRCIVKELAVRTEVV